MEVRLYLRIHRIARIQGLKHLTTQVTAVAIRCCLGHPSTMAWLLTALRLLAIPQTLRSELPCKDHMSAPSVRVPCCMRASLGSGTIDLGLACVL